VPHLLAWVKRGGHLIYLAEGGDSYLNDWAGYGGGGAATGAELHRLPTQLGIKLKRQAAGDRVSEVRIGQEDFHVSFQENLCFDTTAAIRRPDLIAGPPAAASSASPTTSNPSPTPSKASSSMVNAAISSSKPASPTFALVSAPRRWPRTSKASFAKP
jgi:hypothetical protein